MTYTKPQLLGYSAIVAIQAASSQKVGPNCEPHAYGFTVPAYEADE